MRTTIIAILLFSSLDIFGQFYPLEAGIAGGFSSGFSFRAYLDEQLSYEALVSFRNNGSQLHLFRETHEEIRLTSDGSFNLVYGFGSHLGFYYSETYTVFFRDVYYGRRVFSPVLGMDGLAGIEFRFHEIPLSVGLQYKPYMEISWRQVFSINLWDFGFTARYRFKPDNRYY